jgi:hypothetical protein
MTTPTFTPSPAVTPVRGSATFSSDASAWVTWQSGFEPELSVAMPWVAARVADVAADLVLTNADVVTAAASEAAAVGAANFAGAWSGLTGALNIPASVSHSDKVWVLTVNLADVTASEPASGNSDWVSASATGVGSSYFEFLTSGTWTKPSGVTWVFVEAVGGGGGGRNFASSANISGGGGGAYNEGLFLASTVGATETVTIGAGGAGGASGGSNFGSVGGDTSFGAFISSKGGLSGSFDAADGGGGEAGGGNSLRSHGGYSSGGGGVGDFVGGSCVKGGAGGGGSSSVGGTSQDGGNGGDGNDSAGVAADNGVVPGGGGGGCENDGGAGDGANGRLRVWAW